MLLQRPALPLHGVPSTGEGSALPPQASWCLDFRRPMPSTAEGCHGVKPWGPKLEPAGSGPGIQRSQREQTGTCPRLPSLPPCPAAYCNAAPSAPACQAAGACARTARRPGSDRLAKKPRALAGGSEQRPLGERGRNPVCPHKGNRCRHRGANHPAEAAARASSTHRAPQWPPISLSSWTLPKAGRDALGVGGSLRAAAHSCPPVSQALRPPGLPGTHTLSNIPGSLPTQAPPTLPTPTQHPGQSPNPSEQQNIVAAPQVRGQGAAGGIPRGQHDGRGPGARGY